MNILEQMKNDGVKVVEKKGWFWTALHWAVVVVTLGRNRGFLLNYYTTIGPVVGIPRGMSPKNAAAHVLVHEWEHVKQCRMFGWGSAWVGLPLYAFLYLCIPLPAGLAWWRYFFERHAYAVGINYKLANTKGLLPSGKAKLREDMIAEAAEQLSGSMYAWTWPFKGAVSRWLHENISGVV